MDPADDARHLYKQLIDELVRETVNPVTARWIREWGGTEPRTYVPPPEFNARMSVFSAEQRAIVADLVTKAFSSGMFYAIRDIEGRCRLSARAEAADGGEALIPLPVEPFDNTMYEDFVGRRDGWEWPDEGG